MTEHGSKPDPDPTSRTVEQLREAISNLKEVVFTRIDAMDRAITLLGENTTRVPTDVDLRVGQLKELVLEMLAGVQLQFKERDVRVEGAAMAATSAINAALQAQKEAAGEQNKSLTLSINKSEDSTLKQLGALNDKISDLATRFAAWIGDRAGAVREHDSRQTSNSYGAGIVFGILGLFVGVAGVLSAILLKH